MTVEEGAVEHLAAMALTELSLGGEELVDPGGSHLEEDTAVTYFSEKSLEDGEEAEYDDMPELEELLEVEWGELRIEYTRPYGSTGGFTVSMPELNSLKARYNQACKRYGEDENGEGFVANLKSIVEAYFPIQSSILDNMSNIPEWRDNINRISQDFLSGKKFEIDTMVGCLSHILKISQETILSFVAQGGLSTKILAAPGCLKHEERNLTYWYRTKNVENATEFLEKLQERYTRFLERGDEREDATIKFLRGNIRLQAQVAEENLFYNEIRKIELANLTVLTNLHILKRAAI